MKKGLITLSECLKNIESYLPEQKNMRNRFLDDLEKIPNREEVFNELLTEKWARVAILKRPKFFFEVADKPGKAGMVKLELKVFSIQNQQAVMKITEYKTYLSY